MINKFNRLRSLILFVFVFMCLGVQSSLAQKTDPLNLGEVLTGLQSKTGGFSLAQKNEFITNTVMKRGVTFRLTTLIRNELTQVGASTSLMRAIAIKAPKAIPTPVVNKPKPSGKVDKIWTEPNILEKGVRGVRIHAKFNVYNLKGVETMLTIRLQNAAKKNLLSSNTSYRNKSGELAMFRKFTPKYTSTVLNDVKFFLPYREINLPAGSHALKVDADLIYPSGTVIQHLHLYSFTLNKPAPTLLVAKAKFERLWVSYNKRQNNKLGMIIHARFSVANLKGVSAQLAIGFLKQNGTKLMAKRRSAFKSKSGQLTLYRKIKPAHVATIYKDLTAFIPYSEFSPLLSRGKHTLKMHADLIYPDGTRLQHFTEKRFTYTKRR